MEVQVVTGLAEALRTLLRLPSPAHIIATPISESTFLPLLPARAFCHLEPQPECFRILAEPRSQQRLTHYAHARQDALKACVPISVAFVEKQEAKPLASFDNWLTMWTRENQPEHQAIGEKYVWRPADDLLLSFVRLPTLFTKQAFIHQIL